MPIEIAIKTKRSAIIQPNELAADLKWTMNYCFLVSYRIVLSAYGYQIIAYLFSAICFHTMKGMYDMRAKTIIKMGTHCESKGNRKEKRERREWRKRKEEGNRHKQQKEKKKFEKGGKKQKEKEERKRKEKKERKREGRIEVSKDGKQEVMGKEDHEIVRDKSLR